MMQDAHVGLNAGCQEKSSIQQEEDSFRQKIGLKFKTLISEVLHLEQSIVWW